MTEHHNNLNSTLSSGESVPFYFQIMTQIKQQVKTGILKPGDMIPSEAELGKIYGVSRTTVRQALDRLSDEQLIIRRRGKGSFVAEMKLQRDLNHLYSFTDDMRALNVKAYSKIIQSKVVKAKEEFRALLSLHIESEVYELIRLRYASDDPLLLERTYVPYYLCPGIEKEDFQSTSLYNVLRTKFHLNMSNAVETYEAVKMSKEEGKLLNCATASPAFFVKRIAYLDNGLPFEITNSIVRSDKCIFKVELKADASQVNFIREFTT